MAIERRTQQVTAFDGERFDLHVVTGDQPGPAILLLQEIFGVGEFLWARARTLAELGYTVGLPDVFWRVERNVALAHDEASMPEAFGYMERFGAIPAEVTAQDLRASFDALRGQPEVLGRSAVLGYCLGGRLAFELAAASDPDACVSYYGSGIAQELELAPSITCPLLLHFGAADPYISLDDVGAIVAAFAGRPHVEVAIQEHAGHAFENSFAPAFTDPPAAAASWPVTVSFLERTLRG